MGEINVLQNFLPVFPHCDASLPIRHKHSEVILEENEGERRNEGLPTTKHKDSEVILMEKQSERINKSSPTMYRCSEVIDKVEGNKIETGILKHCSLTITIFQRL